MFALPTIIREVNDLSPALQEKETLRIYYAYGTISLEVDEYDDILPTAVGGSAEPGLLEDFVLLYGTGSWGPHRTYSSTLALGPSLKFQVVLKAPSK